MNSSASPTDVLALDPKVHAMRWRTLAVLSLSLIVIGVDTTILNIALPTLQEEFHASNSTLQWMVDSYLLVFAGLMLVFGTLGDRFGRRLALQLGIVIFGLASLATLLVDTSGGLIAVRAGMGVGAGLIMPATLAIIANVFTGEERGKAIGIWSAFAAIGIGLGPLIGGLLLEHFDWWSVFLLNVPIAAVAIVLGFVYVPESRDPDPGSFDFPGAALSTLGFGLLVYGIVEAPAEGWGSGTVLGSLAAAALLLLAFLWRERTAADPMIDLGFFRDRSFSVGTAVTSAAFFALMGGIFAMTQYLQFAHGYSAIAAGALMAPMTIGLVVGSGSSDKVAQHLGVPTVVTAGMLGLAAVLAVTSFWSPQTGEAVLIGWFVLLTLFMGLSLAPAVNVVIGSVPAAKSGVASATNTVARMVSGALGVAVIGSVISSSYSSRIEGGLSALPPQAQATAGESIGGAVAVAAQLPPRIGEGLLGTASNAFVDAMGTGMLLTAGVAVAAAAMAAALLPGRRRRSRPASPEQPEQPERSMAPALGRRP